MRDVPRLLADRGDQVAEPVGALGEGDAIAVAQVDREGTGHGFGHAPRR